MRIIHDGHALSNIWSHLRRQRYIKRGENGYEKREKRQSNRWLLTWKGFVTSETLITTWWPSKWVIERWNPSKASFKDKVMVVLRSFPWDNTSSREGGKEVRVWANESLKSVTKHQILTFLLKRWWGIWRTMKIMPVSYDEDMGYLRIHSYINRVTKVIVNLLPGVMPCREMTIMFKK